MFKEMRRKDRRIEKQKVEKVLKNGEYGVLATVNENDYPYGVPLSYVFYKGAIYFHSATEGQKLANIENNNKVSFTVVGETDIVAEKFTTKYESVIIFGRAVEVSELEKEEALLELIKKYSPDYIEEGSEYIKKTGSAAKVIKIESDHMSGKERI
ncbi:pyridoxamine 5'-phosphate oxidase family protein [Halanaerobium sp. ST460_2HS_T2]|uniref:pyridoxamine 5'-phosphate oxidase family protein n=1 Tax=Halanaerobium sp. ST460_2HS_T2 TaxID=2183914 RepID=UPI000DF207CF|nr:pyridoxamine 5'-phosphate oxidase family protein [Halanaerobium sp. ST460_2HS_T2]RCW52389.1 hypothetical protein DFR80_12922 [Halanaerobium sp. ST460_2HS_T2]